MSWRTPKIVEMQVGMEINMYACAARKYLSISKSRTVTSIGDPRACH
jgi:coenzyme PQQ precursor peptide PqqA